MKKLFGAVLLLAIVSVIIFFVNRNPSVSVEQSGQMPECAARFEERMVDQLNKDLIVTMSGADIRDFGFHFYVSPEFKLMVESSFLKSLLSCSVLNYPDGHVLVMKGDHRLSFEPDSSVAVLDDTTEINLVEKTVVAENGNRFYIPFDDVAAYLGCSVSYDTENGIANLAVADDEKKLPARYDMRDFGRVTPVRDQGEYGTCWAFASLGALETTLLPTDTCIFSTDHMSMCNSYNLDINKGGEHTMSVAYLAAWQGPVYEADDPYGDGMSDPNLTPVKHLEEALVINERDLNVLKSAVFRYGGLETSLYLQLEYANSESPYYSAENASYYYDGEEIPNHDVVVVGWDDSYKKENFPVTPPGDGAWLCKNSWGVEFGEDGYFYVSYYDVNICRKSVVYTRVGCADNYDKIYQTDKLGWVGQMGYGKEEAFFSNVYTAGKNEALSAVSFYATDVNSRFEVYVVRNFKDESSFKDRGFLVAGTMQYAGYYTVDLPNPVPLGDEERFAVVIKITTPGAVHPIAIEYNADERSGNFDISDGEGYISLYGENWHSAEQTQQCNVCLKAFTNYMDADGNVIKPDTDNPSGQVSTEETTDTQGPTEAGGNTAVPNLDTTQEVLEE